MSEGESDSDEGVFQFFIRFVSLTDFPPGEICPPPRQKNDCFVQPFPVR